MGGFSCFSNCRADNYVKQQQWQLKLVLIQQTLDENNENQNQTESLKHLEDERSHWCHTGVTLVSDVKQYWWRGGRGQRRLNYIDWMLIRAELSQGDNCQYVARSDGVLDRERPPRWTNWETSQSGVTGTSEVWTSFIFNFNYFRLKKVWAFKVSTNFILFSLRAVKSSGISLK